MTLPKLEIIGANGLRFLTIPTDFGVTANLKETGEYERDAVDIGIEVLSRHPGSILIDIGAHIGTFSVPIAKATGCAVVAFEAQRVISQILSANFVLNEIDSAKVENIMLGPRGSRGVQHLPMIDYTMPGNFGAYATDPAVFETRSLRKMHKSAQLETVAIGTLDDFNLENVALIKLDVEGAELKILNGAEQTLRRSNFPPLLFESWGHDWWTEQRRELFQYIESLGYTIRGSGDNFIASHRTNTLSISYPEPQPAQPSIETMIATAQKAVKKEQWSEAEHLLRLVHATHPDMPNLRLNLVYVLIQMQRHADAQPFLEDLLKSDNSDNAKHMAARVYIGVGKFEHALIIARHLADKFSDAASLNLLGEALMNLNDQDNAAEAYRQAFIIDPLYGDSGQKYYLLVRATKIESVIEILKSALSKPNLPYEFKCSTYRFLIMSVECAARRRLGLDDYYSDCFEDVFFKHALKEIEEWQAICRAWYESEPDNLRAAAYYIVANMFTEKPSLDTATINKINALGSEEAISSIIIDDAFYQSIDLMSEAQILSRLPPSRILTETHNINDQALFIGCDQLYFDKYSIALLGSLIGKSDNITLHFHIFDPDESRTLDLVKRVHERHGISIRISVEQTPFATEQKANYYHAARFVRFMEYLSLYKAGCWQIDADMLFARAPYPMFDALAKADVGLWMMPSRIEPYNHTPAGIFGLSNNPKSKRYIKLVSGYIVKLLRINRLRWGTDQLALYMCMMYLRSVGALPTITPVTKDMYNAFHNKSMIMYDSTQSVSIIWPGKYAHGEIDLNSFDAFRTEMIAKVNG